MPLLKRGQHWLRILFEVEEDVDGGFGGLGLEPVADVVIVEGKVAEDLGGMDLEFGEDVFVLGFVKDIAGDHGPDCKDAAFAGGG